MMAPSRLTLAETLCRCQTEAFSHRLEIVRRDRRFVNLLCEARVIVTIMIGHAALSSPSRIPLVLPLERSANTNWKGEQYSEFFTETASSLPDIHPRLEICGIICDSLPAQVAGLHAFLEPRNENVFRIVYNRCLNSLIDLVCTDAIWTDPFASVVTQLLEVIHALNSPLGVEIVGPRCPAIIRTR
jgi:hypothetical protein